MPRPPKASCAHGELRARIQQYAIPQRQCAHEHVAREHGKAREHKHRAGQIGAIIPHDHLRISTHAFAPALLSPVISAFSVVPYAVAIIIASAASSCLLMTLPSIESGTALVCERN